MLFRSLVVVVGSVVVVGIIVGVIVVLDAGPRYSG